MSVSAASGDPDLPVDLPESSEGLTAAPGVRLLLTDEQYQRECVLAYAMAVEHIRVAEPAVSRVTTDYVNQVVDNSRLLSGGSARLHLNLLRSQVRWLKSLKPGELL